jgi:hypothetical protein
MPRRVAQWLPAARAAEMVTDVSALLLLAICDRESGGGEYLQPRGPTGKGDGGHGHGLMQLDDRFHFKSFVAALGPDGKPLWQDPAFAFLGAARFLRMTMVHFDGFDVEPLLPAIAAYNASEKRVRDALAGVTRPAKREDFIRALDAVTTGPKPGAPGNYVSDVLERRNTYVLTT